MTTPAAPPRRPALGRFASPVLLLAVLWIVQLADAVLGAKVRVPTLDGAVAMTIPPMSSGGKNFRLRGKGIPDKDGAGDLIVTLDIVLPDKADPALDALMRKWREAASAKS